MTSDQVPVHMVNDTYNVVGFDGSTTVAELLATLCGDLGVRLHVLIIVIIVVIIIVIIVTIILLLFNININRN